MSAKKAGIKGKTVVPNRRKLAFFRSTLLKWKRRNFVSFPWRTTRNPLHGLVAEVMLQRTKAEQVVPIYAEFVRRFPTARSAARVERPAFEKLLRPLGLKWRVRAIRNLCIAIARSGGKVPTTIHHLRQLPGVGDYASSAFSTFHLNTPSTLIDSNIVRLYGRFFGFETGPETRRSRHFRSLADLVQPRRGASRFAYALLDFTRSVCKPRPRCGICPLRRMCHFAAAHS